MGRYRLPCQPGRTGRNHEKAWRRPTLNFSIFGSTFRPRLVRDVFPWRSAFFPYDRAQSIRRTRAQSALRLDLSVTEPEWALGYTWDIVVRGKDGTPFEERT